MDTHGSGKTDEHFAKEEAKMQKQGYPAIDEHLAKHRELRQTVDDLVCDFRDDGVSPQLTEAVETLLGNWLVKHIEEVDCAFGEYVQRQS